MQTPIFESLRGMNRFTGKSFFILIITGLIQISQVFGQAFNRDTLQSRFNNFRTHHLQEKIFVHTDKDNYLSGEILWFSIYNVDASFHKPLNLSSVAYIELTDSNNKAVLKEKSGLKNGFGDGSFFISNNILSGVYKLRVYTSWMKNGAPWYFEKTISIINSQRPVESFVAFKEQRPSIQIFPEGGNLVTGIPTTVAIKVTGSNENEIRTTVGIKDENQNLIHTVQTNQFGLGSFQFNPNAGHTYHAEINAGSNRIVTENFPESLSSGFVLNTFQRNGKFRVTIQGTLPARKSSPVGYLFVHCRQSVKRIEQINLSAELVTLEIDGQQLGEGINHITLFDHQGQPVCERLVFRYPPYINPVTIERNQKYYEAREKVLLTINSPAPSRLSLSVYKTDSLQGRQQSFITDYLLLGSDLHGDVLSPWWYFENVNESVIAAMDNLMLTHGWRRFNWQQVMENKKPVVEFVPELAGQVVQGKVTNTLYGKPGAGINAFLSIPSVQPYFRPAKSDSTGKVYFLVKDVFGTPGIIVQTAPEDSNYRVEIDDPYSTRFAPGPVTVKPGPPKFNTILEQDIAMQVRQNYTGKYLNKSFNPTNDSLPFYTFPSFSYLLDNYTRFTTMEEIFREYVPYVVVRKREGGYLLPMYNDALDNGTFDYEPLLMVDGVPVFNTNKLIAYDPLKVRKIDLITRRYFNGPVASNGIISLNTYNGNLDGFQLDPRAMVIDYESLQLKREFFAPSYPTQEERDSHLPDFRYLLYWDPNIVTGKDGTATTSFYTSDVKGKYIIILQGLNKNGTPCHTIEEFEVK